MISQKESKQVRMDFWLPKLLSADLKTKTKTKGLPTKNHKKITEKKKTRKIKAMGNITPTMDHYPEMDRWQIPILNLICHVNPGNK